MRRTGKLMALFLAIAMVITMLPTFALATGETQEAGDVASYTSIGGETTYYTTLQDAVVAAMNDPSASQVKGGVVSVLTDIDLGVCGANNVPTVTTTNNGTALTASAASALFNNIGVALTIDFGGNTVTYSGEQNIFTVSGKANTIITLKNGTLIHSGSNRNIVAFGSTTSNIYTSDGTVLAPVVTFDNMNAYVFNGTTKTIVTSCLYRPTINVINGSKLVADYYTLNLAKTSSTQTSSKPSTFNPKVNVSGGSVLASCTQYNITIAENGGTFNVDHGYFCYASGKNYGTSKVRAGTWTYPSISEGNTMDVEYYTSNTATATETFGMTAFLPLYTVSWDLDGDGTADETEANVQYGTTPSHDDPTKAPDTVVYTFDHWNPTPAPITGDTTYTAVYTESELPSTTHDVTWSVNGVDTIVECYDGIVPVFTGSTLKPSSGNTYYTFTGWDTEPVAVSADVTYTAQYEETTVDNKVSSYTAVSGQESLYETLTDAYKASQADPDATLTVGGKIRLFEDVELDGVNEVGSNNGSHFFYNPTKKIDIDLQNHVISTPATGFAKNIFFMQLEGPDAIIANGTIFDFNTTNARGLFAVGGSSGSAYSASTGEVMMPEITLSHLTFRAAGTVTALSSNIYGTTFNIDDSDITAPAVVYFNKTSAACTGTYAPVVNIRNSTLTATSSTADAVGGKAGAAAYILSATTIYSAAGRTAVSAVLTLDFGGLSEFATEDVTVNVYDQGNMTDTTPTTLNKTEYLTPYTISWDTDGDGVVDDTTVVGGGRTPAHADGFKPNDADYEYTFTGWDPTIVPAAADVTYTAQFDATEHTGVTYKVTWVVPSGSIEEVYAEDAIPEFKGDLSKPIDANGVYTFSGWDKSIVAVTGDVTYTAQYSSVLPEAAFIPTEGETQYFAKLSDALQANEDAAGAGHIKLIDNCTISSAADGVNAGGTYAVQPTVDLEIDFNGKTIFCDGELSFFQNTRTGSLSSVTLKIYGGTLDTRGAGLKNSISSGTGTHGYFDVQNMTIYSHGSCILNRCIDTDKSSVLKNSTFFTDAAIQGTSHYFAYQSYMATGTFNATDIDTCTFIQAGDYAAATTAAGSTLNIVGICDFYTIVDDNSKMIGGSGTVNYADGLFLADPETTTYDLDGTTYDVIHYATTTVGTAAVTDSEGTTTQYGSFTAAMTAANAAGECTVDLNKDVVMGEGDETGFNSTNHFFTLTKPVTVNLNGHKLEATTDSANDGFNKTLFFVNSDTVTTFVLNGGNGSDAVRGTVKNHGTRGLVTYGTTSTDGAAIFDLTFVANNIDFSSDAHNCYQLFTSYMNGSVNEGVYGHTLTFNGCTIRGAQAILKASASYKADTQSTGNVQFIVNNTTIYSSEGYAAASMTSGYNDVFPSVVFGENTVIYCPTKITDACDNAALVTGTPTINSVYTVSYMGVGYATLNDAVPAINADPSGVTYVVADSAMSGDVTIPVGARLYVYGGYTLDVGANTLTINGLLEVKGNVSASEGGDVTAAADATLTVAPGSSYLGTEVPAIGTDNFNIDRDVQADSYSLNLDENIKMNFYTDVPAENAYDSYKVYYTIDGVTKSVDGVLVGGSVRYTIPDLVARQMGDSVKVDIVGVDAAGKEYLGKSYTKTISDYAAQALGASDVNLTSEDAATKNLAVAMAAMLQYGSAAQNYFDYNTAAMADSVLSETAKAAVTALDTDMETAGVWSASRTVNTAGTTDKYYGTSCVLAENIKLKFYFKLPNYDGSNMTLTVLDAEDGSIGATLVAGLNDYYSCEISVAAADYDAAYTAVITDADSGTTITSVTDSVAAYSARMHATDSTLVDITNSIMRYGFAAKTYFASKN